MCYCEYLRKEERHRFYDFQRNLAFTDTVLSNSIADN
jgi:hypothetical protein